MKILRGSILTYRIYDVASEIDLSKIQTARAEISKKFGKKLVYFRNPPAILFFEEILFKNLNTQVFAKFYEFGAISIILKISLENMRVEKLYEVFREILEGEDVDEISKIYLNKVFEQYKFCLKKPSIYSDYEDYTIVYVQNFDRKLKSYEVLEEIDIAKLLLGEKYNLSEQTQSSLLRNKFSYSDEDLVILSWDSSFIYEPDGIMDVPDLIEFANAQLLELRYYDSYLDSVLDETYNTIEHFRGSIFEYPKYQRVLKRLLLLYNEITEAKEMILNSLKIIEDSYFAKIYSKMLEILGAYSWQRSIDSKERTLFEIYNFLSAQVSHRRLEFLEILIIVVIVLEALIFMFLKI
ncbi:MAG: hypothetical protein ABIL49_00900 [candidate division WOR-3 bacterium]